MRLPSLSFKLRWPRWGEFERNILVCRRDQRRSCSRSVHRFQLSFLFSSPSTRDWEGALRPLELLFWDYREEPGFIEEGRRARLLLSSPSSLLDAIHLLPTSSPTLTPYLYSSFTYRTLLDSLLCSPTTQINPFVALPLLPLRRREFTLSSLLLLLAYQLSALDRNRYQLPAPTSENPTEEEWKAASLNARAQVEHLGVR